MRIRPERHREFCFACHHAAAAIFDDLDAYTQSFGDLTIGLTGSRRGGWNCRFCDQPVVIDLEAMVHGDKYYGPVRATK